MLPSAWRPHCCGTFRWADHIHPLISANGILVGHPLTFSSGFSLHYQTLQSILLCSVFVAELWSQLFNLPELSAYIVEPLKTSCSMKGHHCYNNDIMQLLHFFLLPIVSVAHLMGLSAEDTECEITLSTREKYIHLLFLFACDCFL